MVPSLDGVRGEGREDEEHAVHALERRPHAVGITQISDDRLGDAGVGELFGLVGVVDEGSDLEASAYERRHDEAGELSRRSDAQHPHCAAPSVSIR